MTLKINFLKKFSFFKEISKTKILSLISAIKIKNYVKNDIIYKEGEDSKYIYFVKQGEIEVILKFKEKKILIIDIHLNKVIITS